ncbi:hypothetical protein [Aquimarina pacifica]|uniref:hypothetical protein n=1 Tax=Aquimarina pacifica TaxID=1296415 RepID=UPI000472D3EF|nr:hypothetical protein [Aquimarina pacifica]
MKKVSSVIIAVCGMLICHAQESQSILEDINDQMEIIDSYTEFETFFLEPEEFLDKIPDHGAELNGYYEHERLKKIIRKVGTPTADILTSFYFWNDQLIYVNYSQNIYQDTTNDFGQKVKDYENTYVKYQSHHFYNNGKQVSFNKTGVPISTISPEKKFLSYAKKMKGLLDNKFYNRGTYEALQGKWIFIENTDDYLVFDGTIRFNFYNGQFANRLKTRIEDNSVLVCFFPMDNRIYRYKINDINENILSLTDLFSNEEFVYAKVER